MKKLKKLASILLAAVMVLAMAIPAAAETITIQNTNPEATHTYEAYQVFKGDLSNGKLSNLEWGDGITEEGQNALLTLYGITESDYDKFGDLKEQHLLQDLAEKIEETAKSSANVAQEIANALALYLKKDSGIPFSNGAGGTNYTATVDPGYYVVDDVKIEGTDYDVYSRYIVEVSGNTEPIKPKSDKPKVDKQVQDNDDGVYTSDGDNNAFSETADHEIGEEFQFKLIATLPENEDMNAYEAYKLVFHDTMSDGLTFDRIDSVVVKKSDGGSTTIEASPAENGYKTAGTDTTEWTLTIEDILKHIGADNKLGDGYTVEVTYTAHLNEKANVTTPGGDAKDNPNSVKLEYSNNPNYNGEGETGTTTEDTVHVFTFSVPATKYKDTIDNKHFLAGAGFQVKAADGSIIKFTWDDTQKAYIPNETGEETIKSQEDGSFTIKGLDVGEYTVTETETPPGFNTIDPFKIKITANHEENPDGTTKVTSQLYKDDVKAENIQIINKSGATLPETGGIGTTIFYVLGSILVLGAVIVLVTKKRMSVEK